MINIKLTTIAVLVLVAFIVIAALVFNDDELTLIDCRSNISSINISGDSVFYTTRDGLIRGYDVNQESIETLATIEGGSDLRLSPESSYVSYSINNVVRIFSIESLDVVGEINASIYSWQDDNTLVYINQDSSNGEGFLVAGRLSVYDVGSQSTSNIYNDVPATSIYPLYNNGGVLMFTSGDSDDALVSLHYYKLDGSEVEVIESDTNIIRSSYSKGVFAYQLEGENTVRLLLSDNQQRQIELPYVLPDFIAIDSSRLLGQRLDDGVVVFYLYNHLEDSYSDLFNMVDVGRPIIIDISDDIVAVFTSSGLFAGRY